MKTISLIIVFLSVVSYVVSLDNGLARTPPMGWMTWQRFRCITDCVNFPDDCISEKLIKRTADALVREGYRDAGYEYVVIDDCWSKMYREPNGVLLPDETRFPNGMKAVGDYIHSKGLKFGLYQDYGTHTCAGYPGTLGYEHIDTETFAKWGVDYVKLDGCYADVKDMDEGYENFGRLLNKTGRPIVFSCSLPVYQEENGMTPNFTHISSICNLWRNFDDIDDAKSSVEHIVKYFVANQYRIQPYAGPGHWNDPDMLIIGNFGLSIEQSKAQMARWAILAAPLLLSADMDNIRPEFKEILQNRDVIEVNQDPLGIQGHRVAGINRIEIWTRPIIPLIEVQNKTEHSYAVAFISDRIDGQPIRIRVNLTEIGLRNPFGYRVYDLFEHKSVRSSVLPADDFYVTVVPNGCLFYSFIPHFL